jgi:hypothetical protein
MAIRCLTSIKPLPTTKDFSMRHLPSPPDLVRQNWHSVRAKINKILRERDF